jgi:hypothetical protein
MILSGMVAALLEPSGRGFVVTHVHPYSMDGHSNVPNDHPGVIEHIKTLLKTEHVEPMVGEQNRTGLLTEQYGEYHPSYACEIRKSLRGL